MAQLVVRNLDDDVKAKLQHRARKHGRSTEEEVRAILRSAVREETGLLPPLGTRVSGRFCKIGLQEDFPELRDHPAKPAEFDA